MSTSCIEYDFSDLRGRIKAKLGTEGELANRIGRSKQYISTVFNGKATFNVEDISNICDVLEIETSDIGSYFFKMQVHKSE